MTKIALTGGAYQSRSVISAAQRCLNLFSEPMPQAQGEPAPAAHYPTPGSLSLSTIGGGPIRGIRQVATGETFVVSGRGVYLVGPTYVGTHLGDITPSLTTPVSMSDNGRDLVIVDGSSNGWHVTLPELTFAPIVQTGALNPSAAIVTEAIAADGARYVPFILPFDGAVTSLTVSLAAGYSGHMKCSVFADDGSPAAELASANTIANPVTGVNTFTFASPSAPAALTRNTIYWVGFVSDVTAGTWNVDNTVPGGFSNTPYASFPVAGPGIVLATSVCVSLFWDSDPGGIFAGGDRVDYLDTYFLFNKPNTPQFYSSNSLALTFDPLWFANKESYSGLLRTLIVAKRDIWLIGDKTTEVWANVGAADFPFASQSEIIIDHGTAAKYSAATYDNSVFWLSADRAGQGIVIQGSGYAAKRISTYAIENEIAGYAKIDDAIGFCYQIGGHAFYVLTFPAQDKTWVFDVTTGNWHEWCWLSGSTEHRHRANCYWPVSGVPVVGDWQTGALYALDHRVLTDNGAPIKRVRSFPHIVAEGDRVFYQSLVADMEAGTSVGPNDTISLSFSNDRGHTFGNPIVQSFGTPGAYLTSLQWTRLGYSRDRVFRLEWTAPIPTVLQGIWINAIRGDGGDPGQGA